MKNNIFLFLSLLLFSGCGDFLKEYSLDKVYAKDCRDLDELMIGNGYMAVETASMNSFVASQHYYPFLYLLDDDVDERVVGNKELLKGGDVTNRIYKFRNAYTWQKEPYTNIEGEAYEDDLTYDKLYKHIGVVNVIISYIKEFENDPVDIRRRLWGEALTLRGAYYYLLANIYGLPYAKATAGTDLSVPLKLTEYIDDRHWERSSVQEVFGQIVADLKAGADSLRGVKQPTFYRVDERGARLLLSRVYLYMEEWQLALEETEKVLQLGAPLRDLRSEINIPEREGASGSSAFTNWLKAREYMHDANSKEIFFTMGSSTLPLLMMNEASGLNYRLSEDLLRCYNRESSWKDLRPEKFFLEQTSGNFLCVKSPHSTAARSKIVAFEAFLLRSAEVYLNKAEAEAMLGEEGKAKQTLTDFLATRYAEDGMPDLNTLSGESLVNFIRDERRRELCFECHRWFDLRRYAVNTKYPLQTTIYHNVYTPVAAGTGNGIQEGYYVLKPYGEDKAWVMPFPEKEIIFNDGSLVNNTRDEREMVK